MDPRIEMVSMVKIRPGSAPRSSTGGFELMAWNQLKEAFGSIGVRLTVAKNVFGNEYDVLLFSESDDPKSLHKIDATLKVLGYEAKTHPMCDADEYNELVQQTAKVLRPHLRAMAADE
ncbi:MAG TPA: hypothetical protein VIT43_07675 [Candidatus Dormibacteraeota bacterium]